MRRVLLITLCTGFLLLCSHLWLLAQSKPSKSTTKTKRLTGFHTSRRNTAVTFTLFNNPSYLGHLRIFDPANDGDIEKKNAIFTFSHSGTTIFRDSLFCMSSLIQFEDFNNDGIKDLMIFNYTGGRANPTYHLYLLKPATHQLISVKDFEEIPNAQLNSKFNIISGTALGGMNYYFSFYRITSNNKLIDLGNKFESELDDSVKYPRAIKRIVRKYGKR